ncbi:hypothetical protein, partial [Yersinia rochesterensis]|uniref:hypothetical protein n=2 Tax=Yersinia rochesterensis TaxID=1604335 RepID=UPI001C955304
PNSEVKRRSADGSVGSPHARVGHCQASNKAETPCQKRGVFAMWKRKREKPSAAQRAFFMYPLKTKYNMSILIG